MKSHDSLEMLGRKDIEKGGALCTCARAHVPNALLARTPQLLGGPNYEHTFNKIGQAVARLSVKLYLRVPLFGFNTYPHIRLYHFV